jgi:predicted nucleic acid-binding protein
VLVIDASVAVKWLIPETGHEEASRVLEGRDELIAPSIIRLEVNSALVGRARSGTLSPEDARRAIHLWETMLLAGTLRLVAFEELMPLAIESALRASHPLADCLYLAAAIRLDALVLTADVAMCERAPRVHAKARMLGTAGGD